MSDYFVGSSADYASPQAALTQLYSDVGGTPFTSEHRIVITDGAAYDSYVVYGLRPTATYRLIITAATSSKPVILAKTGSEVALAPVQVRSPYVTIERQECRGGDIGLFSHDDADGLIIKQVMIRDPWRIGIALAEADDIAVINSVVYAPNSCLVAPSCKGLSLFYNTMKNGQSQKYVENVPVPAGVPDPYPAAAVLFIEKENSDTETVYIRDNNLTAINGPVIATTKRTKGYMDSDYNNFYSPRGLVAMYVPTFGQSPMSLQDWRRVSGQDSNSIAEDPRYKQSNVQEDEEDGIYQDLHLKKSSRLRGKAEDTTAASPPSYMPTLTGDFDDLARTTPSGTIGAFELQTAIYNYWDEIFPQSGQDPHGDTEGIYELAKEHYGDVVRPWFPKVKTGFFWAWDNLYYLYADKQSSTLDQLRWYKFTFTGEVIPGTVTAYFQGNELTEDQWNLRGTTFIFKSGGFSVSGDTPEVSITGEQLIWSTGDNGFTTGEFTWSDQVGNAEISYVLDPAPLDGAPIVVTDGSIDPDHDTGELPFGFSVTWDDDLDITTITFQSGELPEDRFQGAVAGDPYILDDVISFFTWGSFQDYDDYLVDFPGLETFGIFTRSFEYEEVSEMTVEWEGSNVGVYEIDDLSLNPIHNPKTEGFLSIRNVNGLQWDRTLPSGESTLADDWLAGRTGDIIPWARITGKNKWHPLIREFSAPIPRAAAYNYPTGECGVIDSVPGPLVALQGTTGEEVVFTFYDTEENPWAFELADFRLSTSDADPTGEFPGYIAKREFGIYTRLGQTLDDVETDSGGHIALRYIPPPGTLVTLYTPDITTGDAGQEYFATPYDIYPDNYGNPTITNQFGVSVTLTGEPTTEVVTGELTSGYYLYSLDRYPDRGTVKATDDGTRQEVVYYTDVQDGQIYVDVENKQVKSKSDGPLTITYQPMLIWRTPDEDRKFFVHADLTLPDYFIVGYDAWIKLIGTGGSISQTHDIVCRNPYDTGDM